MNIHEIDIRAYNYREKSTKVSIIVPVYNTKDYLPKCLDSILAQSYANIEILLIDDGSSDGSGIICDEYTVRDARISTFHIDNSGVAFARNLGIKQSTGEYIAFIDSDDCVNEHYIRALMNLIFHFEADIAICYRKMFFSDYEVNLSEKHDNNYCIDVLDGYNCIEEMYGKRMACIDGAIGWKIHKKSLFTENNIEYPNGRINEDIYTTYKLYYFAKKVVCTQLELYYYRQHTYSIMGKEKRRVNQSSMQVLDGTEEAIQFYLERNENKLAALAINYHIRLSFGLNYRLHKNIEISDKEKKIYLRKMKNNVKKYLKYRYLDSFRQILYYIVTIFPFDIVLKYVGV